MVITNYVSLAAPEALLRWRSLPEALLRIPQSGNSYVPHHLEDIKAAY